MRPVLALLLCAGVAHAEPAKDLRKAVVVAAPAAEVYAAWTTNAGAQTFFAPPTNIELGRRGAFDLDFPPAAPTATRRAALLAPDAPPGKRGAEGLRVLSFIPGEMVSFEWNAPPTFPEIRKKGPSTFVVVQVTALEPNKTKVVLHHLGWGQGADWDKLYGYFDKAWDVVLGRLQTRFAEGRAIDFRKM